MPVANDKTCRDLSMKGRIKAISPRIVDEILEELSIQDKYEDMDVLFTITYLLTNSTIKETKDVLGIPENKYKSPDVMINIETILNRVKEKEDDKGGKEEKKE